MIQSQPYPAASAAAVSDHDELRRTDLPVPSDHLGPSTDQLRVAVAAYPARFKDPSRERTESDLARSPGLVRRARSGPASRTQLELYIRWMQEIRRFKPSTVPRLFPVAAGFDRIGVIDGPLEHSPAEHLRRASVPADSPTLGFTHLQLEAPLTAARSPATPATRARGHARPSQPADLRGNRHGDHRPRRRARHRALRVSGKGTKVVLVPLPPGIADERADVAVV